MWEPHFSCKELLSRHTAVHAFTISVCVCVVAHMPCEQLRGTLQRACFLLQSYETWGWNSGQSQSWWQAPFPTESSHWPCFSSLSHPHQWACGVCLYPRSLAQEVDWIFTASLGLHNKYQISQIYIAQHDHVSKLKVKQKGIIKW